MSLALSVVDFGSPLDSPELAQHAEALGYRRYWLGEHHGPAQGGSPLLRMALVAGSTSTIRVGSAGICLRYHSPLAIAEDAMLDAAMFAGRIDLGVCSGAGGAPVAQEALLDGRAPRSFADKARELHALLHRRLPPVHPLHAHHARAEYGEPPPYWILGNSWATAELAAELGAGFAFSEHHNHAGRDGAAVARGYRAGFAAGHGRPAPPVTVLVSGFCTDDARDAEALARRAGGGAMVGGVDACAGYLHATARRYAAPVELAVLDGFFQLPVGTWQPAQRARMLALIAQTAQTATTSRSGDQAGSTARS